MKTEKEAIWKLDNETESSIFETKTVNTLCSNKKLKKEEMRERPRSDKSLRVLCGGRYCCKYITSEAINKIMNFFDFTVFTPSFELNF